MKYKKESSMSNLKYGTKNTILVYSVLLSFFLLTFTVFALSPAPLDGSGKKVDWWVILKMPQLNLDDLSCDGTTYFYASDKSPTPVYQLKSDNTTPKSLNDVSGNPIAQTLQCMFDAMNNPEEVSYIVYNDEKPKEANKVMMEDETSISGFSMGGELIQMYPNGKTPPSYSQYGHLKGMLVWDNNNGYWLIHSAPKFAFSQQSSGQYHYEYPQNAVVKGQSVICFSFKTKTYLKAIANQLLYNKPQVIQSYVSDNGKTESWYNTVEQVVNKKWNKDAPDLWEEMAWNNMNTGSSVANIETNGGEKLVCFAKNSYWNNDLFSYLIGPTLNTSLFVETWRCGCSLPNFYKDTQPKAYHSGQMVDISIWKRKTQNGSLKSGSYVSRYYNLNYPCPPYDTVNVTNININDQFIYKYTKDHSKWAVSQDQENPWVFIGDINRQGPHSQWLRGGGGVALKNKSLWTFFSNIIEDTEAPATKSTDEL